MKAIILVGGKGERLRPLTTQMNKVLIPIMNDELTSIFNMRTLLDEVIQLYYKFNVFEIWLVGGYKINQLMEKYICPIIPERYPLGTGGWLMVVDPDLFNEDFFVCNGDNLFDLNLKKMYKQHKDTKAVVTIACTNVKDVRKSGSVHIKNGMIQSFEEKKKSRIKKSGYINGGYYLFSPDVFDYVDKTKEKISLEYDIFPVLAKEGRLAAYVSDTPWFSCNDFKEYAKVIKEWVGVNPGDDGGSIKTSNRKTKKSRGTR